ncbi:uncharacterized protein BDZ99DRAFT_481364 [Mytilinidion resinicola]|uniref:Uncharacterized protein n=1 Tax=Mytilinidion resinicola TaxID=574789 RepID=A0A6A6Y5X8_9PEZI|nr:uncharacterized protein BDZ99DRAFT_481364 [Mytilinidion resinicola]KAF2804192.1 hypothetical protein BDZ99DRAFT_481364 [Mytilinidion resinicola]
MSRSGGEREDRPGDGRQLQKALNSFIIACRRRERLNRSRDYNELAAPSGYVAAFAFSSCRLHAAVGASYWSRETSQHSFFPLQRITSAHLSLLFFFHPPTPTSFFHASTSVTQASCNTSQHLDTAGWLTSGRAPFRPVHPATMLSLCIKCRGMLTSISSHSCVMASLWSQFNRPHHSKAYLDVYSHLNCSTPMDCGMRFRPANRQTGLTAQAASISSEHPRSGPVMKALKGLREHKLCSTPLHWPTAKLASPPKPPRLHQRSHTRSSRHLNSSTAMAMDYGLRHRIVDYQAGLSACSALELLQLRQDRPLQQQASFIPGLHSLFLSVRHHNAPNHIMTPFAIFVYRLFTPIGQE